MTIGPQIAFVDDIQSQIEPLQNSIDKINAGSIFFDARPEANNFPPEPIESVKLVFLDLYYGALNFDPELSAQWISRIIAPNSKYILVIWSRDTDKQGELLAVLAQAHLYPTYFEAWQKTDFDFNTYDFNSKIDELINSASDNKKLTDIISGQILEIEEDGLLVNCLLNLEKPTFQVRKFDNELFKGIEDLEVGSFIRISMSTELGSRKIEIFKEASDLSQKFQIIDYFEELKDTAFFIDDND
ncbi:hypothetical protein [Chryseobacterium rhizosphaerae]|uniref:S1 motif domain-containing protein n=1 Tax=Chryseobacterium rhizosphaerae TaxID=395937 RepID=A0ABX9IG18_9FLAO|nr:hypothetical protein [Chryseobacterium rhizosphaerae]REC72650.1 hypothetical protein DRF57_19030 [Chryseobacterium rhizosphaerae]GEN69211.1 hypothetical protein CRH01_37790 [Chryseobacterium rhizosphaerae]